MRISWLALISLLTLGPLACSGTAGKADSGQDARVEDGSGQDGKDGMDAGGDDVEGDGEDGAGDPGIADADGGDAGADEGDYEQDASDGAPGDGDPGSDGDSGADGADAAGDAGADEGFGWRSALYPADWEPGFTDSEGRFLHDFSYAGYHYGEDSLPQIYEPLYDVVSAFGADNTGQADATAAIQEAIDTAAAGAGGVVHFPAGTYRLDGDLVVNASNIILRGDGPLVTQL